MTLNPAEERWLAELQRGIPLCARPFEALARELDCTESDLLDFVGRCRAAGLVRSRSRSVSPFLV